MAKRIYPKNLNKAFLALKVLDNKEIIRTVRETITNGQSVDQLVGRVGDILLRREDINEVNDMSYNFKKALLIRVKLVVDAFNFKFETSTRTMISEDGGGMYITKVKAITGQREPEEKFKIWFKEATKFQDYIVLKGSGKKMGNNSTKVLANKALITMRVKEIDEQCIDLYTTLLYEANKTKVNEPAYYKRLQEVADETKGFMGYEYTNYRKLDSNTRNYPLSRFGFAVEYGDSFEKFMIEPAQEYLVDQVEIDGAIEYLKDEFKTKNYKELVYNADMKVKYNLSLLEDYQKGQRVDFTIGHKELGKLLHIIDVYENIILNKGGMSRSCASYDFTNSGGINAANQFGDKKFMKTMNLLGGDEVFDTHQAVADYLGVKRDDAKGVMQGPNHGGRVPAENQAMVDGIFGETYKYIRLTAEYGIRVAKAGIHMVELVRPDGVKAVWYPYTIKSKVSMEDGTVVSAVTPFEGTGKNKASGLAVSCLHSGDAFTENYIQSKFLERGIHIKTTLDNFYGRPSIKNDVVKYTFEALEILTGHMEKQLKDIERQTGISRGWTLPKRGCELVVSDNII